MYGYWDFPTDYQYSKSSRWPFDISSSTQLNGKVSLGPKNVPLDITDPLNFYEKTNKAFRLSSSLLSFPPSCWICKQVLHLCRDIKATGGLFADFISSLLCFFLCLRVLNMDETLPHSFSFANSMRRFHSAVSVDSSITIKGTFQKTFQFNLCPFDIQPSLSEGLKMRVK